MSKPHLKPTAAQLAAVARAKASYALAESDTLSEADRKVCRENARLWERVAGPGLAWSFKPLRRDLDALKRDVTLAQLETQLGGKAPPPPEAPKPAPAAPAKPLRLTGGIDHTRPSAPGRALGAPAKPKAPIAF
jgi:hypothetical protein